MCSPVEEFFQLVLEVPLDLSPVAVHKGSGVPQASAKERLVLVLGDRNSADGVLFLVVLLLAETGLVPKQERGKGNLVSPPCFSGGKVILKLLAEVLALHVGLFLIHVRETGF